jgi:hypothetical protein
MRRMKSRPELFLEQSYHAASSTILSKYQQLSKRRRSEVERFVLRALKNGRLRADEVIRDGAARLVIALLPRTFDLFEEILSDQSSPYWYEIHFAMFSALDRSDLDENSQRRVISLVRDYILQIPREAGYAAWKAGDLLGDEWLDIETRKILMELALAAKYRAGRKAALHGIEEALERDPETYRDELMRVLRQVAKNDPSNMVRGYAQYALRLRGGQSPSRVTRRS